MSHILVIEDNENLAYGLGTSLELDGHEVRIAHDGEEGLRRAREERPALIVLDLMLPGFDGFRVLKALRAEGDAVPVIVLTARNEDADKVLGFRLGADDYVTKPFGMLELLARVEAVLRRAAGPALRNGRAPPVTFGDVEVDLAARTVRRRGVPVPLAPMEFELLVALLRREGAVATRLDLLHEVWGHRAAVMTRTVDVHIVELRRKLEDDPRTPRHILTVRKAGYRLERQPAATP